MFQEPGNPLRWKQNNTVFKFSSQGYLVLARLRSLLALKKYKALLKKLSEKRKLLQGWPKTCFKICPVKSLLPFETPKITTFHLRYLAVGASWVVVTDFLNLQVRTNMVEVDLAAEFPNRETIVKSTGSL